MNFASQSDRCRSASSALRFRLRQFARAPAAAPAGSTDPRFGVIDVLPDHPHERVPPARRCTSLQPGQPGIDTNGSPAARQRAALSKQIAATSMSGGRIAEGPVAPRCFGAISVYDGHRVSLGRIVCATWHHFVNINLDGTGAGASPQRSLGEFVLGLGELRAPTPPSRRSRNYYLQHRALDRAGALVPLVSGPRWRSIHTFPLLETARGSAAPAVAGDACASARWWRPRSTCATAAAAWRCWSASCWRCSRPSRRWRVSTAGTTTLSLVDATGFRRGVLGTLAQAVFEGLPAPWQVRRQFERTGSARRGRDKLFAGAVRRALRDGPAHYAQAARRRARDAGRAGEAGEVGALSDAAESARLRLPPRRCICRSATPSSCSSPPRWPAARCRPARPGHGAQRSARGHPARAAREPADPQRLGHGHPCRAGGAGAAFDRGEPSVR